MGRGFCQQLPEGGGSLQRLPIMYPRHDEKIVCLFARNQLGPTERRKTLNRRSNFGVRDFQKSEVYSILKVSDRRISVGRKKDIYKSYPVFDGKFSFTETEKVINFA